MTDTFLLVKVVDKAEGSLQMDTTDGETTVEQVVVLTLNVMDPETMERRDIDLAIPRSAGPELLLNLLTEEQWEAVVGA